MTADVTAPGIGINHFGKWPLDEYLHALARHGYTAVDYSAAVGRLADDQDTLASLRALTKHLGLLPAATHYRSFGFGFLVPGDAAAAFRRQSVADVRVAAFLGARAIAFHLGNTLSAPGEGGQHDSTASEAALAAANAEALRQAVAVAEQEGVVVALENHCHGFGDRWEHLCSVADLLHAPAVGFTLDTGHAAVAGQNPVALARNMGERLWLTHLHDNAGDADSHRPAGRRGPNGREIAAGAIAWPSLIAELRAIGYPARNVWMLEGGTQVAGDDPDQLLAAHLAAFRALLS